MKPMRIDRLIAAALLGLTLCLAGCDQAAPLGDDLSAARAAVAERDWPLAERLLRRCLREEQLADRRWEAWNMLLVSANAHAGEPLASLEYLEVMLEEFADSDDKTKSILERMGVITGELRRHDRSADVWSAYIGLSGLSPEELVLGYRRLAATYFRARRFDAGEDILQQCLALYLPNNEKLLCMYDLADLNIGRERWQEAADMSLQIFDAEADGELAGLTGYLLADALEQLGKTDDALKQFQLARDFYPNTAVIDKRIAQLRKKRKK
jgi:tetratricopeptide (TPR) repeat protein